MVYKTFLAYLLVFYVNRLVIGSRPLSGVLPISLLFLGYHVCSESDAGGIVYVDSDVVPDELLESAREGAAACPAEAIAVQAPA